MNVQQIVDTAQLHGFEDISDNDVLTFLNLTYQDLCGSFFWEFLTKRATVPTVQGQENLGIADLRAIQAIRNLTYDAPLEPLTQQEVVKRRYDLTQGQVLGYYISHSHTTNSKDVYLRSVPAGVYQLYVVYYRNPADLTLSDAATAIAVPIPGHEVLLNGLLYRLYKMNDDIGQMQLHKSLYDQGVANLMLLDGQSQVDRPETVDDLFEDEGNF